MEQTIHLIYSIFAFVVGLMFGSFFTLATYRIPRKQDITHTRSYCPKCKHKLGFFDCFPILSYVSTIGRCRYCWGSISIRYPLMELANGFVFLFIYLFLGFTWEALVLVICYVYLFLVIGSDIMEKKMTDEERLEVENIIKARKEAKLQKKNKKAGAINVEILVAIIIFVFFFFISAYTISNYTNQLALTKRKIDATGVLLNVINYEKTKSFYLVSSYSDSSVVDGVTYNYTVSVTNNLKGEEENIPNAKNINVTVNYSLLGETYQVSLDTLKVVPLYEV